MFLEEASSGWLMYCDRGSPTMVSKAFRATNHVAALIVWHSMRVSLLADLDSPQPPSADQPATQAA